MQEQEISLYDLIKFYLKNWAWIVSLTLVGLIAGLGYSLYLQTPLYKSEATLLIIQPGITSTTDTTLSSYVELFKSRRVLEPVMKELQVSDDYDTFSNNVEATNSKNTAIIKVAVVNKDPNFSKAATDKAIVSFQNEVKNIYEASNVRVVDGASQPASPYNVNILIQTAVAFIAGFMLSVIGLFFAYDYKASNKKAKNALTKAKSDKNESVEMIEKRLQDESDKKLAAEAKAKKIAAKKAKKEAKKAASEAKKRAKARRKAIAKKAYINKIKAQKAAKEKKRQQTIKTIFSPLMTSLEEKRMSDTLKREVRRAEKLAKHEERMAEIETRRVSSVKKRATVAVQSKKITSRAVKDTTKTTPVGDSKVFYANIQGSRLDRRGLPFGSETANLQNKKNILGRIKRNISKSFISKNSK